jgi:hypothetical protein
MYHGSECGCGQHGKHHEEHEGHSKDCGCGGHEHHSMNRCHHGNYSCGCHQNEGTGFHRRFVSREEIISKLEDYLKQLHAEAKGVEERITELKKEE